MDIQTKKLTPKQIRAAEMIAAGGQIRAIASSLGVAESTIYRWKEKIPEFNARIDLVVDETCATAIRVLSGSIVGICRDMIKIARDPEVPDKVRASTGLKLMEMMGIKRLKIDGAEESETFEDFVIRLEREDD